jgi:hypothetical protein
MKSAFWRSLALALVVAVVLPTVAFAGGEVARSSMAGTNFMNTSADTWVLFHRSLEGDGYGEFVSQGYNGNVSKGGGDNEGFARLTLPFGDYRLGFEINDRAAGSGVLGYAWNAGPYNHAESYNDFGLYGLTIGDFVDEFGNGYNGFWDGQMASIKGAFAMGTGSASIGAGIFNDNIEDNTDSEKFGSTGFNLNASWGNGAPATAGTIELVGEFTTHSSKDEVAAGNQELSGNHFAVDGRYSVDDDNHIEGAIAKLTSDYTDDIAAPSTSETIGLTAFKVNYVRDLVEEADHGALVEVSFDYLKFTFEPDANDPAGSAEISESFTAFPSCRFSAWHEMPKNLSLYGGVEGSYLFKGTFEDPNDSEDDQFAGSSSFSWTAGLGWDPNDHIGIEFFLMTSNLDQILSLGNTAPLIGGIGAHSSW